MDSDQVLRGNRAFSDGFVLCFLCKNLFSKDGLQWPFKRMAFPWLCKFFLVLLVQSGTKKQLQVGSHNSFIIGVQKLTPVKPIYFRPCFFVFFPASKYPSVICKRVLPLTQLAPYGRTFSSS